MKVDLWYTGTDTSTPSVIYSEVLYMVEKSNYVRLTLTPDEKGCCSTVIIPYMNILKLEASL